MIIFIVLVFLLAVLISFACGVFYASGKYDNKLKKISEMNAKHLSLFFLMCKWIDNKQKNKLVYTYLIERGYRNIAIYGMSFVGKALYNELYNTGVNIIYGIDNSVSSYRDLRIFKSDDNLQEVDIVIVTPIYYYDEIFLKLSSKISSPILALDELMDRVEAFQ